MKTWALLAGLSLLWSTGMAEVLRLATGELPPYATEARGDKGVALRIVREAFRSQGHDVAYTFMPWGRALEEARAGKWDGTAYWGHKPEHEKSFLLSENVLTEQWVVLHRAALQVDWKQPADLAPYTFGAIKTYTYTPQFHALFGSGKLKVDWSPDDIATLRKLAAGRVDVVLLDRNVACFLIDQHLTGAEARTIRAHPKLMTENFSTHLMLPKALPQSAARLEAFNKGLAALRASGEYRRLLESTECGAGLAVPQMPR